MPALEAWQDFKVSKLVKIGIDGGGKKLIVSLEPTSPARCDYCGAEVSQIHDSHRRQVKPAAILVLWSRHGFAPIPAAMILTGSNILASPIRAMSRHCWQVTRQDTA